MPMRRATETNARRAANRRAARWGWRRRWGLGALVLGVPVAHMPLDVVLAQSLPQGGNIVGGAGTIQQTSSTQLTINQTSQNLSIDWQSFSVGAGHIVRFNQPSSSALALNRVIGPDPSQIFGSIQANGRVVIMNPAGIYFGPSSMVDVNGLVATTARMNQADFLAGTLNFSVGSSDPNARVVNEGAINVALGGFAVLAAAAVENKGTVIAQGGTVVLAGTPTFTVDFHGDGLLKFAATGLVTQAPNGASALVENSGTISANGGRVIMTARSARDVINNVINTTGIVEARSARVENGEIVIDGGDNGIVRVNGLVDASGNAPDARGGNVTILGERVGLFENARVDVSGPAGGGQALVGGNYKGQGPEPNAKMVYMDARAVIDASATGTGDGGRVILWSDEYTSFQGTIFARGGALGGNGGFVETSSKDNLQVQTGRVHVGAALGLGGTWLLDPRNVSISTATVGGTYSANVFTPTADSATIDVTSIVASLNAGSNVEVNTGGTGSQAGDINVDTSIAKTTGGNATLTLNAAGAINVNYSITSTTGQLGLNFWAGGSINVGATINTNGGSIATAGTGGTGSAGGLFTASGSITTGAGNVTLNQAAGISMPGILTSTGTVTLNAAGGVTAGTIIQGPANLVIGGTGTVTLTNAANAFSNITINRTGTTANVSITNSITGNFQTSTLGTGSFTYTSATAGFTQSGAITQDTGGGTVTISGGTGTVTLNQANTWTDNLNVSGGTINVNTATQTFTNTGGRAVSFTQSGAGGSLSLAGLVASVGSQISLTTNSDGQTTFGGNIATRGGNITAYADAPGGITGSGTGAGNRNGVSFSSGAVFDAGGGNITIVGRGGNSANNVGVSLLDAQVQTSGTGYISIEGLGTSTAGGHSIVVDNSSVTSTGTGSIAFMGYNPGGGNTGLVLQGASVTLGGATFQNNLTFQVDSMTSSATSLSLTRQAGGGTVTFLTASGGNVILNGTGSGLGVTSSILNGVSNFGTLQIGSASSTGNVSVGAAFTALNNMNLSLIGTSGTATVGYALTTQGTGSLTVSGDAGVTINANLTTGGGDILIKGNVSSWTTPNTSTAPTFGSASGTFTGVAIASGVTVTAAGGNIAIAGKGGDSGINQYGVSMSASSVVSTTGSGTINIVGEGGASASNGGGTGGAHIGLYFNGLVAGTHADIVTANGNITLTGTGAGTAGTSDNNAGVALLYSRVRATGTGQIDIVGTAGFGASRGVVINLDPTAGATVSAAGGAINITGTGGGALVTSGFVSRGIDINEASVVSTGAGNITLRGIAGSAGNGLAFLGTPAVTVGGASHTGNTTLRADNLVNSAANLNLSRQAGGGTITFRTDTDNTSMGIAAAIGTLQLDSTLLSAVSGFGEAIFGSATQTGSMVMGLQTLARDTRLLGNTATASAAGVISLNNRTLTFETGGAVSQTAQITGAGTVSLQGAGNVTLTNGSNSFTGLTLGKTGGAGNVNVSTTGALSLGTSTMGTGTLTLLGAGFSQTGGLTQDAGGGAVSISAGSLTATLGQANSISGDLTVTGGVVTVSGAQSLARAGLQTVSLTASGGNVLVQSNITKTGTGGANISVTALETAWFDNAGINSGGGNITIWGNAPGGSSTAGTTAGTAWGVRIDGASAVISAGTGNVSIVGKGATDAGAGQHGIVLFNSGSIETTTGSITLTGRGGDGTGSGADGIIFAPGGHIDTVSGTVTLTGFGGANSANGYGITLDTSATLTASSGATITLNGTGTNGGTGFFTNASTSINAGTGALSLTSNNGLNFANTALIAGGTATLAGGAGAITATNASNQLTGNVLLTNSAGNVSLTNSVATALGTSTVASNFTLVSGGNLTQSGAMVVTGTSSITANGGSITLTNGGNSFTGNVALTTTGANQNASISAGGGLTLGAVSVTGDFTASATGGLTLGTANSFAAGKNVTLTSTGVGSGAVTFNANQTLSNGALNVTSARTITVSPGTTINSGGGDITMTANSTGANGGGDFSGIFVHNSVIESRGGNIALTGRGSASGTSSLLHGVHLYLGGIVRSYTGVGDGTTGTITLTGTGGTYSGGGSGDNGGVTVVGPTSLVSSLDGNITINATGGTGASGGNSGLYVGGGTIRTDGTGSITATASGGPGNASRAIAVTGNGGSFGRIETIGGGNITLTGTGGTAAGNNVGVFVFGGASNHGVIRATAATGNISITGTGGVGTGTSNVGIAVQDANSVISTNGGTLTLNGTATSSGTASDGVYVALGGSLASANGTMFITGSSSNFTGIVLNGDVNAGTSGMLTLNATAGGVTQSSAGTITAESLILRGSGNFSVDRGGSGFNTIEHVAASVTGSGNISLRTSFGSGLSRVDTETDASGPVNGITTPGNLTWVASGALSQVSGVAVNVAGTTTLTAQSGGILLDKAGGNSFAGTVTLDATGAIAISSGSGAIALGNVSGGGAIAIIANGNLSQNASTTITQSGPGAVSLSSTTGSVALRGITTANGDLTVSAGGGGVTQSGAGLNISGNADITSVGGNIALNGASNSVSGTIALSASGGNVDWSQASGNAIFGSVTAGGSLSLDVTGGSVSQVGAFNVTGVTTINGSSASLTNPSNAFGGALSINVGAGAANVAVAGNLILGNITAGDFTATVPGNLTQTGVLSVSGIGTTLTVDGTTTLTNGANNFGLFLDLLGTGTGALDGTVGGLSNAAALPFVTASFPGYTFGGSAVTAIGTTPPQGFDPFAALPADFLAFLNTFLTSLAIDPVGPGGLGGFDGAGGPGGPVFSPANILAFLAEPPPGAAGGLGGPGGPGGPGGQGGPDGNNAPPPGPGAPPAGAGPIGPLPPAGAFALGQTVVVRTASGAQPVTVTAPAGAATPQVILRGLLNSVQPFVPSNGTPFANYPVGLPLQ